MMLAGTGRKLAFMLRKMLCIVLDTLGTAVLAAPIFLIHAGMPYLVYKYLVYTSWFKRETPNLVGHACRIH